jgi:hypothetical protein
LVSRKWDVRIGSAVKSQAAGVSPPLQFAFDGACCPGGGAINDGAQVQVEVLDPDAAGWL